MRMPSIRRTLLLRCGFGVGILLCLLSTATYLIVRHGLIRELDRSITQTAALLSNQVELEDGVITFEWKEGFGTNRVVEDEGLFQFWNLANGETTRSPRMHGMDLPKFYGENGKSELKDIQLPGSSRKLRAIGMRIYPYVTAEEIASMKAGGHIIDPKSMPHVLVVARDKKSIYRVLNRTRWVLGVGTLLTLGLGFLLIDRVIRATLRPIDELTTQVGNRVGPQLDSALELPEALPTELIGLAKNFDSLLARVANIRQREQDFIRHAAHELRTPIAGLRATTDLALSQPRDAAAYAAHLSTCQKTAVELGELVKRLSALSRIGQEATPSRVEQIDAAAVLAECLEPFLPLLEHRGLKLTRDLPAGPVSASGDVTLLRIIFNNLLDNAASYATPGGEIRIHGGISDGKVEFRIANQAEGLPENLDRLFEPLFRKESSRSDADVHLGIGLTLSLEAAAAMGATLQAQRTDDGRIEFVLEIQQAT